ncbi:ATP-binding protein [Aneurinibacillus migulanus]|uniref:ATP-binding protein n=1 Tax=Aneurinibacillus migulanus TaxID=47500 RepID=UPI0020A1CB57|nr:ATP-binding protein [Aneurinibacillus migulanus]MCP1355439.1 ATP-binding protein [Aneurinibacillus migulanus]
MKSVREFLQKPNMIMDSKALEDFRRQREEEDRALVQQILKDNAAAKRAKLQRIFDENSLIPKKLLLATFENYIPKTPSQVAAIEKAKEYVESYEPDESSNLLYSGPCGVGKSHLMVSITKQLMKKGFTCLFISVPLFLTKVRSTYKRDSDLSEFQLLQIMQEVDCLVLDDIGIGGSTDWAASKIFEVIEVRSGAHTLYTTNLNGQELEEEIGERSISRLMDDTETLQVFGEDKRRWKQRRASK